MLLKKMFRTLWRYKAQFISMVIMIALVLGPATWLVSVLLTFGVSLAVGLLIPRKNKTIDMVAALKTEE